MNLAIIQANSLGKVIRVTRYDHEHEQYRAAPDAVESVTVALRTNRDILKDVADNMAEHTIEGGVVKRNGTPVVFDSGDDGHSVVKFFDNLSPAQINGLRAGAKSVITGLKAGSSNVEKAIGWIAYRMFRTED